MKIFQEKEKFEPINISLESAKEAALFIAIIDKIDYAYSNGGIAPRIKKEEYELVRSISDWFTEERGFR